MTASTSPAAEPDLPGRIYSFDELVPPAREFVDELVQEDFPFHSDYLGMSKVSFWLLKYARSMLAKIESLESENAELLATCNCLADTLDSEMSEDVERPWNDTVYRGAVGDK